jgi:hypothetical protein
MRRTALALVFFVLCACGDGLLSPPGSNAGPFAPLPSGPTFLDARIAGCPTAAEVDSVREVNVIWDELAQAALPLVCRAADGSADLTRIQKRIYFALILMKELRFTQPLPWTDKPLYEWFRDLTNGVRYTAGDGNSSCCFGDRIPNIYYDPQDERPVTWSLVMSSIGLLVHESRHIETGPHRCQYKWDNLVSEYNGYGVSYTFYKYVGLYSDPAVIPVEYRPNALWIACRQLGGQFCMEPKQVCQ